MTSSLTLDSEYTISFVLLHKFFRTKVIIVGFNRRYIPYISENEINEAITHLKNLTIIIMLN